MSVVVVVVYPLLPACWGESVSVALWGFAASHLAGLLRQSNYDHHLCLN